MVKKILFILGVVAICNFNITSVNAKTSIGVTPSYLDINLDNQLKGSNTVDVLNMGEDVTDLEFECYIESTLESYQEFFSIDVDRG